MTKPINWNEVKVGETEICRVGERPRKVLAVFDDWVWLKDLSCYPCTYYKNDLTHWTIYDPLEDITDQITLEPTRVSVCGHGDAEYVVFVGCYKGKRLLWTDPNISFDGQRVWKRKEGV